MSDVGRDRVGWAFVGVQAILLIVIVVLPTREDWPTPTWVQVLAAVLVIAGLVLMAVAARRLGPALTATPVPNDSGALATGGLYRHMRHPIYTAVLLAVAGLTLRSGSFVTLVVAVLTVGFFHVKAGREERWLSERYPDYPAYAARTPRFIPRIVR